MTRRHWPLRARGGIDAANAVVEADETDGVALSQQQQRQRGGQPFGVRAAW